MVKHTAGGAKDRMPMSAPGKRKEQALMLTTREGESITVDFEKVAAFHIVARDANGKEIGRGIIGEEEFDKLKRGALPIEDLVPEIASPELQDLEKRFPIGAEVQWTEFQTLPTGITDAEVLPSEKANPSSFSGGDAEAEDAFKEKGGEYYVRIQTESGVQDIPRQDMWIMGLDGDKEEDAKLLDKSQDKAISIVDGDMLRDATLLRYEKDAKGKWIAVVSDERVNERTIPLSDVRINESFPHPGQRVEVRMRIERIHRGTVQAKNRDPKTAALDLFAEELGRGLAKVSAASAERAPSEYVKLGDRVALPGDINSAKKWDVRYIYRKSNGQIFVHLVNTDAQGKEVATRDVLEGRFLGDASPEKNVRVGDVVFTPRGDREVPYEVVAIDNGRAQLRDIPTKDVIWVPLEQVTPGFLSGDQATKVFKEMVEIKSALPDASEYHILTIYKSKDLPAFVALRKSFPDIDLGSLIEIYQSRNPEEDIATVINEVSRLRKEYPDLDLGSLIEIYRSRNPEEDIATVIDEVSRLREEHPDISTGTLIAVYKNKKDAEEFTRKFGEEVKKQ